MEELLTQEHVDFYQANGFVQVNGVLSSDELEELRGYLDEVMQDASSKSVQTDVAGGLYYRVLNQRVNTWRDHGGMAKYSFHPRFATMARRLAGVDGIRFFHDHALWKMPGDSKPTPWHQDLPYWPMEETRALSIWIALDDVDKTNGCMMFIPKSHRVGTFKGISLTDPEDLFEYAKGTGADKEKPVIARMRAGSCTFHSGLTFHYAHANRTAKPRRALAIIYIPDGTVYNGKKHVVTDGAGLAPGEPFRGGLFPRLV
ncbi:MAG: phytanoyl-CoA dioxygenase family protein [Alicyclobacillus herbarius]|uniref:phytanoyl-CoA dioxygenase family protein n=1 Tax=Alicyclobacillus herbarius TaxID=122960 RepID=UPI002355377E|nr:phytanoyl-CoA dioxygenase family protein [Alicyclobacillus herbarius]MCL6633589.1 phytanoyl-CoA dioxygenase family protein [Alicyclobacillus herbarius]